MLNCYDFAMAVALNDLLGGRRKQPASTAEAERRPRAGAYFISSRRSR